MANDADLVITGGRVIDPETGLDAVRNVLVSGGEISAIAEGAAPGARQVLDAFGKIVAPGFIDLHSHSHSVGGLRLQAMDGVTTALELEAGVSPVGLAYARAAEEGRPVNYGFSASWALHRQHVVAGAEADARLESFLANIGNPAWQLAAKPDDVARIIALLEQDLDNGALGIGILLGYAPGVDPDEYLQVARLAAEAGVPTYTHARDLIESTPDTLIDGATEIVRAASETGAHMHYCHVNSTSRRHVDRVLELIERVRRDGSRVTTEAYPYGAGSTGIGAAFLEPELLPRMGLEPSSIVYAPTGERIAHEAQLRELRATDPGGLAVLHFFDENNPADRKVMLRALIADDTVIASDAMPLVYDPEATPDPLAWPLPSGTFTHPRTAGTFSRSLRILVDEVGLSWPDALRRCTLLPAQVLDGTIPSMRRKGRLQVGCDADIVVFDPERLSDQATYTDMTRPSVGVEHLIVGGEPLVRSGVLRTDAMPGRPVTRT